MKVLKSKKLWLSVDFIVAILASLIYFVILPFQITSCIIAYVFFIVCILAQSIPLFINGKTTDAVFRMPIVTLNVLYFIIQLIISTFYAINVSKNIRWEIVICSIALAIYIIALLVVNNSMAAILLDSRKTKCKVFYIDKIVSILENCKLNISDGESAELINRIIDLSKYSDPMSSNELADIESEILSRVTKLQDLVKNNKILNYKQECLEVEKLFKERNLKCKLYK